MAEEFKFEPAGVIDRLENLSKQTEEINIKEFRDIKISEIKPNPNNPYPVNQIEEVNNPTSKDEGLQKP